MTTPGSPGTASDGYRIPAKEGRHRAPPPPPAPPRFLRWLPHITVAALAGIVVPPAVLAAVTVAPDASAAAVQGVTVSTATRTARTVHVPLMVGPLALPTIGAEGAWEPATPTTRQNPLYRPVPSRTFAGATVTASASTGLSGDLVAITTPSATTVPETTAAATPTSPASTSEAAATTSSAPTSTEETTPMPTTPATTTAAPTDTIGEIAVTTEVAP